LRVDARSAKLSGQRLLRSSRGECRCIKRWPLCLATGFGKLQISVI
jgi:hypothetical protein